MEVYSYSAFHHVESPSELRGKRNELLEALFRLLTENGFKKYHFWSNGIWKKNGSKVIVSWHETLKKPLLSGIGSKKPFKSNVMICVDWDQLLEHDEGLRKIRTWL